MRNSTRLATLGLMLLSQLADAEDSLPTAPLTLYNNAGQNAQWSGVGRLLWKNRLCIGTLLDSRDATLASSGPAYVLTAGHCAGGVNGKIIVNQPMTGSIAFNYFADTQDQRRTVPVKQMVWSSMQGADLALLELDATLEELLAQGITPVKIGPSPTSANAVKVIGEPSSLGQGLRLSTCTERFHSFSSVNNWVWRNVRRNDCQGLDEGASGSPVVDSATHRLISVVNSLHDNEVGAIPIHRVQGCFRAGQADLELDDCQLLPGFQLTPQGSSFKTIVKARTLPDGSLEQPRWGFEFLIDTPRYRYKTSTDALACEDPVGYSGTIAADAARIDDPIGATPGTHYLCLVGVQSPDQSASRALMANSLSLAVELLPPGRPKAEVSTERLPNGDIQVNWLRAADIVFYRVKRGPAATTHCDDHSGYRLLRSQSVVIAHASLPLKLCSVAIDVIRQSSEFRTDLLEANTP
ncbi:trypsin-like peptidase domain-containing protein [Pseudomonas putida]|uniref:trypsin-like peptidase domain-containing protein n=1 Tax=Pseudomonas putida TaxID=303 RepID=UPI0018D6FD71|nr:trypsin-like peptidase domain-containing protein [Pseudomonas putida]MBH3413126.1 trypsin-like peptidase domain-containing protein [Pseudomonas putida]